GGAEVTLPAAAVQASQEAYIGLVEAGVGLIPGGGGTKELYLKMLRGMPKGLNFDLQQVSNDVFERIATAKVVNYVEETREVVYYVLYEADDVLIPGGDGTKELYLKMLRGMPKGLNFDLQQVSNAVFERIATAEVATSAEEARELGFLDNNDGISVNPDHLLHEAMQ